jgi:hypothetical protein
MWLQRTRAMDWQASEGVRLWHHRGMDACTQHSRSPPQPAAATRHRRPPAPTPGERHKQFRTPAPPTRCEAGRERGAHSEGTTEGDSWGGQKQKRTSSTAAPPARKKLCGQWGSNARGHAPSAEPQNAGCLLVALRSEHLSGRRRWLAPRTINQFEEHRVCLHRGETQNGPNFCRPTVRKCHPNPRV